MKRLEEKRFPHGYVHFECDSDHFPFLRKPEAWDAMLDRDPQNGYISTCTDKEMK